MKPSDPTPTYLLPPLRGRERWGVRAVRMKQRMNPIKEEIRVN
jgi:hypothetical protein